MTVLDYIPLSHTAGDACTTAELRMMALDRMRRLGYPYVALEFSPAGSGLRFDLIGVARHTRQVRIYEIKASRADFLRDEKWRAYLPYCTQFSFVAPAGLMQRWELPAGIGLVEYGSPALPEMLGKRRFGFTIAREDCLRSVRPALRLRPRVEDREWIALLETIALGKSPAPLEPLFSDGAGI